MAELLENQPALHYPVGADAEWDARVMRLAERGARHGRAPASRRPTRMQRRARR